MNKTHIIILITLLAWLAACSPGGPATPTATAVPPTEPPPPATVTPTALKPTATAVKPTATATIRPTATATATPATIVTAVTTAVPTATATAAPTEIPVAAVPADFSLTLIFAPNTECGFEGFEFVYDVALSGDTISMLQVAAGLTSSGPYDPATGIFSATISGLPGTETYTGEITAMPDSGGATAVAMSGIYTYTDDPNVACEGSWPFAGETTIAE